MFLPNFNYWKLYDKIQFKKIGAVTYFCLNNDKKDANYV